MGSLRISWSGLGVSRLWGGGIGGGKGGVFGVGLMGLGGFGCGGWVGSSDIGIVMGEMIYGVI